MNFLRDRGIVLALGGAAVALIAGLAIAWFMVSQHRGEKAAPPPASRAGLVIDSTGQPAEGRLNPAKSLRCFVAGQSVGDMTLADCAKRNGVSTDALDVGLDQSGALAAGGQTGTAITPLPPSPDARPEEEAAAEPATAAASPIPSGPPDACWRYAAGQWRKLTPDLPLAACAQTLFAGRCERSGEAAYGRWGQQTLRLVPGRIEISGDNRSFRPLMDQPGCPPAG